MPKHLTLRQIDAIRSLAKAEMSLRDISNNLRIKKTTVYYHARNYCRKMTKLNLALLSEFEKGYIVGLFLGDGDINKGRKTPRYIVRFSLDAKRDQDISARLHQIFKKGRKKTSIFPRDATLTVKVCSKELLNYIQTCIEYKRNRKKLQISKDWSLEFQYGILAGIIDSDGHVHKHLGTEIKTVSPSIFEGIINVLTNLGIKARTKRKKVSGNSYSKKNRYVLYIPSTEIKAHQDKLCSVKIERFL